MYATCLHTVQSKEFNDRLCATVVRVFQRNFCVNSVYGDSGYLGAEKRDDAITRNTKGKKIKYKTNRRPSQSKKKTARSKAQIKRREHEKSSVRAMMEHVFGVVKGHFGYRKTRYRGLPKQTAKMNMLFALANPIQTDRPCLAV